MSEAGFLQAICEEPDDDAHRLVFADWLDEHGRHDRAEFIRVQCALARLELDDSAAEALRLREADLIREHGSAWRAELPRLPEVTWSATFRRGFIEVAAVPHYMAWRNNGVAILRAIPLALLQVGQIRPGPLRRLSRSPGIRRVPGLDFPTGHFEDADLEVLARACRLRVFCYSAPNRSVPHLGPDARHIFATMPGFANLERLALHNVPFGNGGAARLAGAPNTAGLVSLELRRCQVTALGVGALAGYAGWGRLRSLDLSDNFIRDDGCRAIASSPGLGGLRELSLTGNNITSAGVTALARSLFLCRLCSLMLSGCPVGDDGAEALANSANLRGLRSLSLEYTRVSATGAIAVLRSPLAEGLRWLNLRGVAFDDGALTAVAETTGLESLQTLLVSAGTAEAPLRRRFGGRVAFL